ncbi:molybdopterin converting factor, subunit 1 [Luminiphilus syltensis NOR5-1B]|uniref:Putative beta-barrel assembly-enhancing protease n=1 Tax=Luminiphilus syltensis NOR5-1B TaxID=565045 RepID=B8KWW6_9GAMM|nr:M48 family metalloprotease [Luminiphilus syltensis]EED36017.1 molybdopterin converting factor, subunit 1 [Luminiphilus syltensis NOR5-1B]
MLIRGVALMSVFAISLAVGTDARSQDRDNSKLKIPNLGESSTSLFSADFEYEIGRTWLKVFRRQAPTIDDPLLYSYLENLVFELVNHSELQDRRIDLVIVDNPTINAFAVPGGVIGVHNGLFEYAQTEDEFATVIAHEIAHLSQRHFSRRVELGQKQQPLNIAGLIAGLVLAATVGGDAGMAALSTTQAAIQNSQLRYSRANEAEADRIGMQTLTAAGMDPYAAPQMFERMFSASRYSSGNRVPEFLRTHPLSEKRIADTRARALQHPRTIRPVSLDFQLMRARVKNHFARTPAEAVAMFNDELEGKQVSREANIYGLALALTDAGRADEAALALDGIWSGDPDRIEYVIADAEIELARGNPRKATEKLNQRLKLSPGNHPLTMAYAHALQQAGDSHVAEQVLVEQSRRKPTDPGLWYLLAEVQGLAGNIVGLHRSRAEYFILNGSFNQAKQQLTYALKLSKDNFTRSAKINERLEQVQAILNEIEKS